MSTPRRDMTVRVLPLGTEPGDDLSATTTVEERPLLITRRDQPIAEITPPSPGAAGEEWIGAMRGSARITGDMVTPVTTPDLPVLANR